MTIKVEGQNPPTFRLAGSGYLVFLHVMEVPPNGRPSLADQKLWEIRPATGDRIDKLPKITYGQVPPGCTQTIPKEGAPPSPLIEGKTYEVGGPASSANGGTIWFTIKDGQPVRLPKRDGTTEP